MVLSSTSAARPGFGLALTRGQFHGADRRVESEAIGPAPAKAVPRPSPISSTCPARSLSYGGSRGLGLQMVRAFAEAGADVVVASRKLEACELAAAEVRALGRRALAVSVNASEWAQMDALAEAAYK